MLPQADHSTGVHSQATTRQIYLRESEDSRFASTPERRQLGGKLECDQFLTSILSDPQSPNAGRG